MLQTLPTVNGNHFFMNILCIESFCTSRTHIRTLLFGSRPFWPIKPASEYGCASLLPRLSWSWTVLLPSDTHRKPITSITSVLLPFVTYLLTPFIYYRTQNQVGCAFNFTSSHFILSERGPITNCTRTGFHSLDSSQIRMPDTGIEHQIRSLWPLSLMRIHQRNYKKNYNNWRINRYVNYGTNYTLKMAEKGFSETPVPIYKTLLSHVLEYRDVNEHDIASLKSTDSQRIEEILMQEPAMWLRLEPAECNPHSHILFLWNVFQSARKYSKWSLFFEFPKKEYIYILRLRF
jgi:hypothetical protein